MLTSATRFAHTRTWTIDINDYGTNYYKIYHVVSATSKSLLLLESTLFDSDIYGKGNDLMDKLLAARESNERILNESTTPRRFMLKKGKDGDYFVTGSGTASTIVRLNGKHPVTYINVDKKKENEVISTYVRKKMRV